MGGGMQGMQDFLPTSMPPATILATMGADGYLSNTNSSAAAMLQLSSSGCVPDELSSSYGFSHTLFTGYEQQMMLAMTLMTQAQQGLQQLQTFHPGVGANTAGTGSIGLQNNHFLNHAMLAHTGTTLSTPRGEDTASVHAHEFSQENQSLSQGYQEASSSSSSSERMNK